MRDEGKAWDRLNARVTNKLFLESERLLSRIQKQRKWKIHFSCREEWIVPVRDGFRSTPHEIAFGELTADFVRDCDFVVAFTMGDLRRLAGERDLVAHYPIPIPSMECIDLCDDKVLLNRVLTEKGFGGLVPKSGGALAFPFILKKKIDEFGKNSHILTNEHEKQALSEKLESPDYFVQEFLVGPKEYATHILFKNDRIVASINVEYGFAGGMSIKGKDRPIYTKVCRCPYLGLFSSILRMIGFEGLCCLNYKIREGKLYILEINPRFGGSLCPYFFSLIRHLD